MLRATADGFPNPRSMLPPGPHDEARRFLEERLPLPPRVLLVLGSGLGALAREIADPTRIPYAEIPGFPPGNVVGHPGALVCGTLEGVAVAAMQGRFHLYEGWAPEQVVAPVRAFASLGIETMLVTNAAGGVRPGMRPGDLMLIADHLNLLWKNPLTGAVFPGEDRFPDMSEPYDAELRRMALEVARELEIPLSEGVYAALTGPSYETPAEIRMLRGWGADAVGMSTVPEVLVARARYIRVVGISCITNLAAGLGGGALSHAEVLATGERVKESFSRLLRGLLRRISG